MNSNTTQIEIPQKLMPSFMEWAAKQGQSLRYKADGTLAAAATQKATNPSRAKA